MDGERGKRLLKRYLSQFYRAKKKQEDLRERAESLRAELRSCGGGELAAIAPILGDIEDRILRQTEAEAASVVGIMDILEFLPADSTERDILEYRHIDCRNWGDIMDQVHLSKSPTFDRYNKGLEKLLTFPKVVATLEAYEARLAREAKDTY